MNYAEKFRNFVKEEKIESKQAVFFHGRASTYGELVEQSDRVASALFNECDVKKGTSVGIYMSNSPEVIATFFGILKLGAIVLPINPLLTAHEIKPILESTKAQTIFVNPQYLPTVNQINRELPYLKQVISVSKENYPDTIPYFSLLGKAGSSPPEVEIEDDDVAVIFFTAGTTGIPKGAMLTTRGLMTVVKGHRERFYGPLGELVSIVAGLPLSHIYGLNTIAISSLFNRSPVVIEEDFNPEKTARDIEAYRVSVMFGVPNHFLRLLDYAEKFDLRSLRLIMIGGQYIPEELWQKIDKTFDCYGIEGYGLTEGTGHTISSPLGDRRPGSTGIPFGGTEIKIFDNNGNELPVGEVGEIVQKSPANMKGYLNLPEITDQTLQQGWLRTGDFGRMDEDGHVYVVGRKKELIIRGGFNVYPSEVENVLFKHPQVSEAAVFGVNDPLKGETVAAAVLPEPGENLIEEELINYCKERLARYKVPKYIDVMESPLPKSPTGKILKRHLQDEMSKKLEDKQ